jgi:ParB-like chromosome segregation protein Spo0J
MPDVLIPDALKSLLKPVTSLTQYPKNAQVHTDEDVAKFCKVLAEFGWTAPLIAWPKNGKTYISAGHLRYRAALAMGLKKVPVVLRPEWNERQFRAAVIADNQWTRRATSDLTLLKDELVDLDDGQFDLTLTGFAESDIERMLAVDDAARETAEDIRPISQVHVMLSFAPDQMAKLAPLLEQAKTAGAEVEQGHT